jgi:hypothetical protein
MPTAVPPPYTTCLNIDQRPIPHGPVIAVPGSFQRNRWFAFETLALVSLVGLSEFAGARATGEDAFDPYTAHSSESEIRRLQLFPDGLIYHPYLAGPKESRTGVQFASDGDGGWSWYATIGGQVGLLRYGTLDNYRPVGIELDIEGSAQFRSLDGNILNTESTDIRFGVPLTVGWGGQETKLELCFLGANPDKELFQSSEDPEQWFFERRSIVLGHSIHFGDNFRIYGEVGYAFQATLSGEWEFQFGAEYVPVMPTHIFGAPFAAANVYVLEVDDYGGNLTLEAGWCWRGKNARLLRGGVFYSNGFSNSFAFQDRNEQMAGFGLWHDF